MPTDRSFHVASQSEWPFWEDTGYLQNVVTEEMALLFLGLTIKL